MDIFCGQVKELETHLQRLQSDLHTCVSFIQEPKKLKESVQTIFSRHVPQANGVSMTTMMFDLHPELAICSLDMNLVCVVQKVETNSMDEDIRHILSRHREHLEKTVSSLKLKLAKSAEEHDKVYVKLTKVKQRRGISCLVFPGCSKPGFTKCRHLRRKT